MDELFARSFGLIQLHSLGVSFCYTQEEMNRPYRLYGTGNRIEHGQFEWCRASADDRGIFLTDRHETEHFATLTSTPAGVLLWRLYQVIVRDSRHLTATFREAGIPIRTDQIREAGGLVEWCRAIGLNRLKFVTYKLIDSAVPDYFEVELLPGLDAVLKLFDLLMCSCPLAHNPLITGDQFADLLNRSFDYMARRCDIELFGQGKHPEDHHWTAVWASRAPNAPLFTRPTDLSMRGVLELLAYAFERLIVRESGGTADDLINWAARVPNEYRVAFDDWFAAADNNETQLRDVLLDGLLGRIDLTAVGPCPDLEPGGVLEPAFGSLYRSITASAPRGPDGRPILYVEDEWPWARCRRIRDEHHSRCPVYLRPAITVGAIARRRHLSGEGSYWVGAGGASRRIEGVDALDPYGDHLRRLNDVLLRNIGRRRQHYNDLLCGRPCGISHSDLTRELLLIEYQDGLTDANVSQPLDILAAALFGASNAFDVQFVRGRTLPDPRPLGRKVSALYHRMSEELSDSPGIADVYRSLANAIDTCQLFSRERLARELHVELD